MTTRSMMKKMVKEETNTSQVYSELTLHCMIMTKRLKKVSKMRNLKRGKTKRRRSKLFILQRKPMTHWWCICQIFSRKLSVESMVVSRKSWKPGKQKMVCQKKKSLSNSRMKFMTQVKSKEWVCGRFLLLRKRLIYSCTKELK